MFRTEAWGHIYDKYTLFIVLMGTLKNTANHGSGFYTSYDAL